MIAVARRPLAGATGAGDGMSPDFSARPWAAALGAIGIVLAAGCASFTGMDAGPEKDKLLAIPTGLTIASGDPHQR